MVALAQTTDREYYTRAANEDCINGGPRTRTKYSYDADGNMTNRAGTLIQWNSENLPVSISQDSGDSSQFSYAPDQHRYYQAALIAGVAETTVYVGGYEAWSRAGVTTYRHHLMAYGREVAEVDLTNSGSSVDETVSYVLTDHLGSVDDVQGSTSAAGGRKLGAAVITGQNGAVVADMSFSAFGQRREPGTWQHPVGAAEVQADHDADRYGFTHQEMLDDVQGSTSVARGRKPGATNVALIHMNGRVYDPSLGRFLSADPNVQAPLSSQGYDRYAYVDNNPLSLNDPSGYFWLKGLLVTGDPLGGFFPQLYGQGLGIAAPFFSLIPGCEGWCTMGAEAVSGYMSSGGDVKAGVYAAALTAVSGNFGGGLRTASGAVNWTAVAYQVGNDVAFQINPDAAAKLALIEGEVGAYGTGNWKGVVEFTNHQFWSYEARREEARIAERNGMSPLELNALLSATSVAGDHLFKSRYNPKTHHYKGVGNRGLPGVPFDIADVILAEQGLPTGASYRQIFSGYRRAVSGHSLGAMDANNMVSLGFASAATVDGMPIFAAGTAGVKVNQGSNDVVTGVKALSLIFNPFANYQNLPTISPLLPGIGNHACADYYATFGGPPCN